MHSDRAARFDESIDYESGTITHLFHLYNDISRHLCDYAYERCIPVCSAADKRVGAAGQ